VSQVNSVHSLSPYILMVYVCIMSTVFCTVLPYIWITTFQTRLFLLQEIRILSLTALRNLNLKFNLDIILRLHLMDCPFQCGVDNKPTRCHFCVMLYFLLYKLLNMFRATMCPSSGTDDWLVLSPRVGIVLWLQ